MSASTGPTGESERIAVLDVLRGFALLGILVMNIQSFSMIGSAYFNPTAYGSLEGLNLWVWAVSHLLADLKFMGVFSMLFGAGIVLMWQRCEKSNRSFLGVHYRRMGWLLLFGLLHSYLLWFGDILFPYAVCGMIVCWFRKLRPGTLIVLGFLLLLVGSSIYLLSGLSMPMWPEEDLNDFIETSWSPSPEGIEEELATYRGGWLEQMPLRAESALGMQVFVLPIFFLWRAGGLMLLGMGLFKLGVFSGERSKTLYALLAGIGALAGLPLIGYGIFRNFEAGWPPSTFFVGLQLNYWASISVSLGWVGVVTLIYLKEALPGLTVKLAAVGRMALSNYLLQTLICTTIFYGHGLGYFGYVSRVGQICVVVLIWVGLLLISPWWLSRFRYGPFEWLWRSLSYWSLLPFRR